MNLGFRISDLGIKNQEILVFLCALASLREPLSFLPILNS